MNQFSRRIVGFGVHAGDVDGIALCCMFNSAIRNKRLSQRLNSDNDPLFRYRQWQANLRILEIEEIKSIPCPPTSHPSIERLIGNRVEGAFEKNILIVCFSGMLKIWSESWRRSDTIATNIEFFNHWQAILPCHLSITLEFNVLNLITIPRNHTAMVCFKHRSLLEFRIRHVQVKREINELLFR